MIHKVIKMIMSIITKNRKKFEYLKLGKLIRNILFLN